MTYLLRYDYFIAFCLFQGGFVLQPDQMQVINPLLVVIMVPIVESLFFPCLNKLKIPNR